MAQAAHSAAKQGSRLALALAVTCCLSVAGAACVDGGPHPEPPDPLGPPSAQVDGGIDEDDPSDEEGGGAGAGGAAGGASAGVGGSGGGPDAGEPDPTECADAGVDGGCDDGDAGALR